MTQELIDLRTSLLEERYADALLIVDELEAMSKQAILRNIIFARVADSFTQKLSRTALNKFLGG